MERKDKARRARGRYTVTIRGNGKMTRVEVLSELLWRRLRERW